MEAYRKQCEDMVRAAVDDAIAKDDMASVMTYCQMFGPLKLQKEGVRTLVGFVTKKIRANAKEATWNTWNIGTRPTACKRGILV